MPRGKKKAEESAELQTATATPEAEAEKPVKGRKTISKTKAVKRALAKLGSKAMPTAIHEFVLTEFGMDMKLNHISNIKSTLKHKKGKGKKSAAAEAEPMASVSHAGNGKVARGNEQHAGDLSLADIEATKQLAQRVGVTQLHTLIDLLAK